MYPLSLRCRIISVPVQTCSGELFIPLSPCTVHSYCEYENMLLPLGGENVPLDAGRTKKGTHQGRNVCLGGGETNATLAG